jgi:GntR family transcriptional regulator
MCIDTIIHMPIDGRFRFHVAPSSGVPIYRQIFDQVRAQIATGRLADGDFLPSVRQVAGELAVNPMTVSKAYSLLERDGVVELVRGHGMRVIGRTVRQRQSVDRDQVVRLVRRLVKRGRAAGLTPEDLCALVNATFEEFHHERVRSDAH